MEQDWIFGAIGGLMIGISASMLLLINGRIMGASGILGGLVDGSGHTNAKERLSFIGGLVLAPFVLTLLWVRPDIHISDNLAVLIVAGLFVGFGSRFANGCTSGHGVCGISRLSARGMGATIVYLSAGAIAMIVFRHMLGLI